MHAALAMYPTAYYNGAAYHPAIGFADGAKHYWPNITYSSASAATLRAAQALADVQKAANAVTESWNVYMTP